MKALFKQSFPVYRSLGYFILSLKSYIFVPLFLKCNEHLIRVYNLFRWFLFHFHQKNEWFLFHFCLKFKSKKKPFCDYKGPWNFKDTFEKGAFCFLIVKNQRRQNMSLKGKLENQFEGFCLERIWNLEIVILCL